MSHVCMIGSEPKLSNTSPKLVNIAWTETHPLVSRMPQHYAQLVVPKYTPTLKLVNPFCIGYTSTMATITEEAVKLDPVL